MRWLCFRACRYSRKQQLTAAHLQHEVQVGDAVTERQHLTQRHLGDVVRQVGDHFHALMLRPARHSFLSELYTVLLTLRETA